MDQLFLEWKMFLFLDNGRRLQQISLHKNILEKPEFQITKEKSEKKVFLVGFSLQNLMLKN